MKIDKKMIDAVLKLNDDALWKTIQLVGKKYGAEKIVGMEKPSDMTKIRNTLRSLTDEDISSAEAMLKRGKQNGK